MAFSFLETECLSLSANFGENIDFKTVSRIGGILNEELPIPYFFDILHFEKIKNEELKMHIIEKGKVIYTKKLNIIEQ